MNIVRERLYTLVAGESSSEKDFVAAECALLIAAEEYPGLDIQSYLDRLAALVDVLRGRLTPTMSDDDKIAVLNHLLFEEYGFDANMEEYYDVRNSYLNEVLDRKLGIPVTLSILYLEIGQKIGLPLSGAAFPGHFLVRYQGPAGERIIDPYFRGRVLDREKAMQRLQLMIGRRAERKDLERALEPVSLRDIVLRLLQNLKSAYQDGGNHAKALAAVDRLLLLAPERRKELRTRAMLHERLGYYPAALADYMRYLGGIEDREEAESLRRHIAELSPLGMIH